MPLDAGGERLPRGRRCLRLAGRDGDDEITRGVAFDAEGTAGGPAPHILFPWGTGGAGARAIAAFAHQSAAATDDRMGQSNAMPSRSMRSSIAAEGMPSSTRTASGWLGM